MRVLPFLLLLFLSLNVSFLSPIYGSEEEGVYAGGRKKITLSKVSIRIASGRICKAQDKVPSSKLFINLSLDLLPSKRKHKGIGGGSSSSDEMLPLDPSSLLLSLHQNSFNSNRSKRKRIEKSLSSNDKVLLPDPSTSLPLPLNQDSFNSNLWLMEDLNRRDNALVSPFLTIAPAVFTDIIVREYLNDFTRHDFITLTSLRLSCSFLCYNATLMQYSYASLYRRDVPKNLTPFLYQAVMIMGRSLTRKALLPYEPELNFIEEELGKAGFNVAVAFILGVRGDEGATYDALKRLAFYGDLEAQKIIIDALYEGRFGEERRCEVKRFEELWLRAIAGSAKAHQIVADAFYEGEFGQQGTEQERFKNLELLAEAGNKVGNLYAQMRVIDALYYGDLNQDKQKGKKRFEKLSEITQNIEVPQTIRQYAHKCLIDAIYEGRLGQRKRSEAERFDELKAIAAAGSSEVHQYAQKRVIDAIYEGKLGQEERSEEKRFAELQAIAASGSSEVHQHAQKHVNRALMFGTLGQQVRPGAERFAELWRIANAGELEGNQNAREYTHEALYWGSLGQETRLGAKRFAELQAEAAGPSKAHQNAQRFVNMALMLGSLGQGARPEAERHKKLRGIAALGSSNAQGLIINSIRNGKFGYEMYAGAESISRKVECMYKVLEVTMDKLIK